LRKRTIIILITLVLIILIVIGFFMLRYMIPKYTEEIYTTTAFLPHLDWENEP
jgi:type II secretory pathway component PulF